MKSGSVILDSNRFQIALDRLAHEIIENFPEFNDVCLIGIQEKGVVLAKRLMEILNSKNTEQQMKMGTLDISFYRDDFRTREIPLKVSNTDIEFSIEGKSIILVDDVLYSGRTIQAAISALQDFGRPAQVKLLVMVDRRFNRHLPIKADYTGLVVDALDEAYVRVRFKSIDKKDQILIFSAKDKQE